MEPEELKGIGALANVLRGAALKVRSLEAEAQEALFSSNDTKTHREKLQEKALLLMDLPEMGEPCLRGGKSAAAREIRSKLKDFERRAGQALDLASIFYMSVLLYPADYKEGEKNDLETFIDEVEKLRFPPIPPQ